MEAKELVRRYTAGRSNFERASLSQANLSGTDLYGANLGGANLEGANLSHANLEGADVAPGQLSWEVTLELEGATMPDGTKHE